MEALGLSKRLGAEKLRLQNLIKQNSAWKLQLQRILDFEASSRSSTFQDAGPSDLPIDQLDDAQAAEEFGYHPLTERELTQSILENKRDMQRVQNRLLTSTLDPTDGVHTHRWQGFGWDIVQRVDGGVMECVFTKRFSDLDLLTLMQSTWSNDMRLERFKKVKAETCRLQVLQQLNPNVCVMVRDVASPTSIATFRSVFVRFLLETTQEITTSTSHAPVTGVGYVLGTQSVLTERQGPSDVDPSLAWADLAVSIEAFDVVDPTTGETYQHIRWTARTDYCSEEHARRNAADTLQGALRWEMLAIAPALNLISLT